MNDLLTMQKQDSALKNFVVGSTSIILYQYFKIANNVAIVVNYVCVTKKEQLLL